VGTGKRGQVGMESGHGGKRGRQAWRREGQVGAGKEGQEVCREIGQGVDPWRERGQMSCQEEIESESHKGH
jgi:hypothetical protein